YNEATMGYHANGRSDFSGVYHEARGWSSPNVVGFMESHDEQRLNWKNQEFGNYDGDYDITELPTALDRMELAGAFFFTIPGPKMLWQFGELGYDFPLDEDGPGRTAPMPVPWDDYLQNQDRLDLYNTWSALNHLRKSSDAFRTDDVNLSLSAPVKRIYLNDAAMNVAIIGNFDVTERTVSADVQETGVWYDYFAQEERSFSATDEQITLQPGEFVIYTSEFVELPDGDFIVSVPGQDEQQQTPSEFALKQNYPNPFNPTTNIEYELSEAADVRLEVFNMLGQRVSVLYDGMQSAGTHTASFDGSGLSSGVYLVRMQAAGQVFTNKMMLVK
ncbi:MAG: T9SS type A sorting domain-containing protein, partial [Cyclonatronaceae bacterium]